MKKFAKRIFLTLFVLLVLIIGALIAIPYFFKDQLVATIKEEINNNVNAQVDFTDVDISLIRSFPDFSLKLVGLEVIGIEDFDGLKLAGIEELDFTLDVMSVINSAERPVEIKSVNLIKPEINVLVLSDGSANYDIAKAAAEADTTTTTTTGLQILLNEYAIEQGKLTYEDRTMDVFLDIENLNHSGEGDFTLEVFDLTTKTDIEAITLDYAGIGYLKKAKVNLDAGFNIDMPNSKYTLKENNLIVNALELNADGYVAMPTEAIEMDLVFNAPQNNFKNLLSLIPNAYTTGYEDVKADGSFQLGGFVKGTLTETAYPAFKIALDVGNANIQYPDLPLGISDINTKVLVDSKTSDLDKMVVDVSTLKMKIGNNPIDANFKIKTPMSDPDVDAAVTGKLDLAELAKAFPMEGVEDLNGIITSDIAMQTKYSTIEKEDYENVKMSGNLGIQNMNYVAADMPPVKINDLQMDFTPRAVNVANFNSNLGKSDLQASGSVDNILAYFSPEKTMTGTFTVRSKYFNADEWMVESSGQWAVGSSFPEAEVLEDEGDEELFNRFDFALDAQIDELDYDIYDIKNIVAKGSFNPNELAINQFGMDIGDSDLSGSGVLTNVWNYVFKNETLGGDLTLNSDYFDLNQFMTEEEVTTETTEAPAATEPILVPDNVDVTVNANMKKVHYDNIDLNNIRGKLIVANEAVRLMDVKAKTLGGDIKIDGGYATQGGGDPIFDFGYNLSSLNFQKAFNALNSFQAMAPIGKFLEGSFNSTFSMSSELGDDLMPKLESITASGFMHTLNAKLANFPPLQKIGEKLDIKEFKSPVNLEDTKNWFEVQDGGVEIKAFDYAVQGINMQIGGNHKLTGDMNYAIIAKIPRKLLGKNSVGAAANSGLAFLNKEADKLGLDLKAGEFVNVQINLTGTITDPKVKIKLLGSEGEASLEDAVVSNVKEEAEQKLEELKEDAVTKATLEAEKKVEDVLGKSVDSAKTELEEKAGKVVDDATKKLEEEAKKKVGDEVGKKLGEEGKKKVDEAKKVLEGWNPLKKKKKKNN